MGRSCVGYQENISTCFLARSYFVIKITEKLHCVYMGQNVFLGTEISFADRRDIGDRDRFCPIRTQLCRLTGKLSLCTLQNVRHSGNSTR